MSDNEWNSSGRPITTYSSGRTPSGGGGASVPEPYSSGRTPSGGGGASVTSNYTYNNTQEVPRADQLPKPTPTDQLPKPTPNYTFNNTQEVPTSSQLNPSTINHDTGNPNHDTGDPSQSSGVPAAPTKEQIENAMNASYIKAIDKALAGNTTELKALDMKTFGAHRPEAGYSKEFLTKQKKALSQGLTVTQYDQIEQAIYGQYVAAIDKALAGDFKDLKALDMKMGGPRSEEGYSREFLEKQRAASALGVSVAEYDKRMQSKPKPEVATSVPPVPAAPTTSSGQSSDSRESNQTEQQEQENEQQNSSEDSKENKPFANNGNSGESNTEFDSQAAERPQNNQEDSQEVNSVSNPGSIVMPTNAQNNNSFQSNREESRSGGDDPVEIDNAKVPGPGFGIQNEKREEALAGSQGNSEEHRKDAEAHSKAMAAQAEADERKQEALAVATANKQSAKEARLKKIMEMRKPYMGGAASVNGSNDAMVVPPITPASQVPPPPLP